MLKNMLCVAAIGILFAGCHTNTWVFTPDPKEYPCHWADGSADINADWCFPKDGTQTCCHTGFHCIKDGCEGNSNDNPADLSSHPENRGDDHRFADSVNRSEQKANASSQ